MGNIDVNRKQFEEQPKVHRPKFRTFFSPFGQIQKLFINGRIERVTLGHDVNPESCAFIPILDQIVVISNVEPGVVCYAVPLATEESGYKILTVESNESAEPRSPLVPENAVRGLMFWECALRNSTVRERYIQRFRQRNNMRGHDDRVKPPKLFVRYGDREPSKQTVKEQILNYRSKLRTRRSGGPATSWTRPRIPH